MRRIWILFFVCLFFTNLVFALGCQYTKTENYHVLEEGLYNLGGEYIGAPLEFKDFSGGIFNIQGCKPPSFKIYNPTDKDLVLNISYQTSWSSAFGTRSANHQTKISINKYTLSDKLQGSCPDLGSGSISQKSINYVIFEPEEIILKNEEVTKQRDICKLCNKEICLNDGTSCNPLYDDSKCGAGFCNIAGFCGKTKIVDCPNGKLNCNNKICLKPSIKEVGEAYDCSFECKSGRFENGTCLKSFSVLQQEEDKRNRGIVIFGVIILIILSAGVGYFAFYRRKKEEKLKNQILEEKNALVGEIDNLKKDRENLQNSIKSLNSEIENINLLIKKGEDKIGSLKNEIKDTVGKAREELEKRLKFEEQRQKDRIAKIKNQRKRIKKDEDKIKTIEKDLGSKKLKFEKENKEFFIKKALDKYKQMYPNIYYDKETGYIKFLSQGNEPLHRYFYKKFEKNLSGKEIHHIDKDKLNNESWNLVSIPNEKHKKLSHLLIDFKDWKSGIKQLKEQLDMKDSDFPEHIQKEIEKRRQQKRLSNYARKGRRRRR